VQSIWANGLRCSLSVSNRTLSDEVEIAHSFSDVVGEVTFSRRFGFLTAGKDDGSFSAIDSALLSAAWIGQTPWLYWLHDFFMPYIGNYLGVNNRNGSLRQFAARECDERKGRGSDHRDILHALMDVKAQKPNEFDDNGVLSMAASNIFAGSDTTGISIGAVLYNLCKNPSCKRKLSEEIRETIRNEDLDPAENIPFKTGHAMPYLQACIYEALRMHPAVGMSLPRVVPEEGFEIDGTFIPAGVSCTLGMNCGFLTTFRRSLVQILGSYIDRKRFSVTIATSSDRNDGWKGIEARWVREGIRGQVCTDRNVQIAISSLSEAAHERALVGVWHPWFDALGRSSS
jgi:hypothetical protein